MERFNLSLIQGLKKIGAKRIQNINFNEEFSYPHDMNLII